MGFCYSLYRLNQMNQKFQVLHNLYSFGNMCLRLSFSRSRSWNEDVSMLFVWQVITGSTVKGRSNVDKKKKKHKKWPTDRWSLWEAGSPSSLETVWRLHISFRVAPPKGPGSPWTYLSTNSVTGWGLRSGALTLQHAQLIRCITYTF